jgi:pimeloyl-ACP methyl ester carboxylesterase
VFVAAFAPEEGETLGQVTPTSKDAILGTALLAHRYPMANGGTATEFVVDPAKFRDTFAADLPADQAAVLAATQRPVADAAFSDVMRTPAWKDLPSWAVIATGDKAAGTDLTRSMAERAGASITELDGSHVIMISQPQVVAEVILKAVAAAASRQPIGAVG